MRVALVSPYSWTTPGGVNNQVAGLAAALRARGHVVQVLAPADGRVEPGVLAVGRTVAVPFNGSVARLAFGPRVASRVRLALRATRPDVVHVHEPFSPSASMLAVRAARAPVVATFHAAVDSRLYRAARPALMPLWSKLAGRIAVSPAARESVERVFGAAVRVVPNAIDVLRYATVPPPEPGSKTVLYFGRLERRKGPVVLARAFPSVLADHPDARLLIAGTGPAEKEVREALRRAGAAARSTGAFDEDDRARLLGDASVACFPALGGESFGIVLLEAMAAGRAVVASDIPGFAAVLGDGRDGVLVPPGDERALARALSALLADPARIAALGETGRARAARYDWSRIAGEIEEVYEEVVARAAPR